MNSNIFCSIVALNLPQSKFSSGSVYLTHYFCWSYKLYVPVNITFSYSYSHINEDCKNLHTLRGKITWVHGVYVTTMGKT